MLSRIRLLRPRQALPSSKPWIKSLSTHPQTLQRYDTDGRAQGFAKRIPRQPPPPRPPSNDNNQASDQPEDKVARALQQTAQDDTNNLLSPVHIPDDPHGVLTTTHPAMSILANSSIVVQRQLEMMNLLMGFEQANKYIIMDGQGNHIGYLAERDHGLGSAMARQAFRTHRSFTTHVFDRDQKEVLRFHRPFSWISSRIHVYDAVSSTGGVSYSSALDNTSPGAVTGPTQAEVSELPLSEMRIIGEAQQQWAPLRRKYNLFLHRDIEANSSVPQLTAGDLPLSNTTALTVAEAGKENVGFAQFAYVDERFLSWDFSLRSEDGRLIGSVNRDFSGFAREIFTDTGVYALRMDSAALAAISDGHSEAAGMTLDQRAVMLATAVSIDFDYFSRHSHAGGMGTGFMPIWFPMGGAGGAAEGAAGEAGAAGSAEAGAMSEVGNAAKGVGAAGAPESAIAGAGTLAGYEAMQRGRESMQQPDQQQQQPLDPFESREWADDPSQRGVQEDRLNDPWSQQTPDQQQNDPWGDFWGEQQGGRGGGNSSGGSGDGGGGGDGGSDWGDWF